MCPFCVLEDNKPCQLQSLCVQIKESLHNLAVNTCINANAILGILILHKFHTIDQMNLNLYAIQ